MLYCSYIFVLIVALYRINYGQISILPYGQRDLRESTFTFDIALLFIVVDVHEVFIVHVNITCSVADNTG